MANRRKFLAGIGSLAAGSAAAMGTGAFSTMNAERTVNVNVAGDANAFLGIETEQSKYARQPDAGTAKITLNSDSGGDGNGVNANADTRFDGVLKLDNNGDREVAVRVTDDGASADAFKVWVSDSDPTAGGKLIRVDDGTWFKLGQGESAYLSVGTLLRENDESGLPDQLTIQADDSIPHGAVEPQ